MIIKKIICKIFGHIYPLKKLSTPKYLLKMFPEFKDKRTGAFVADTSKPCGRCCKLKKGNCPFMDHIEKGANRKVINIGLIFMIIILIGITIGVWV